MRKIYVELEGNVAHQYSTLVSSFCTSKIILILIINFNFYNHTYSFFFGFLSQWWLYIYSMLIFRQSQSSNDLPRCKDFLVFPSLSCRVVSSIYPNPLLTSGKVEMLLFSKFNSSSALHFASDLGIADSLLYLRPRRFKLDRFPVNTKQKNLLFKNMMSLLLSQTINQIFMNYCETLFQHDP